MNLDFLCENILRNDGVKSHIHSMMSVKLSLISSKNFIFICLSTNYKLDTLKYGTKHWHGEKF